LRKPGCHLSRPQRTNRELLFGRISCWVACHVHRLLLPQRARGLSISIFLSIYLSLSPSISLHLSFSLYLSLHIYIYISVSLTPCQPQQHHDWLSSRPAFTVCTPRGRLSAALADAGARVPGPTADQPASTQVRASDVSLRPDVTALFYLQFQNPCTLFISRR
jgi:hypothetical protein